MGLDVYVGSFTRYYARDWETVVQKYGREQGYPVEVVRGDPPDALTDQSEIRAAIVEWRDQVNAALGSSIAQPLDWDESAAAPYFTDKPAWDAFGSLLLWAAYAEHPDLPRPVAFIEDYASDPAYQRSANPDFKTSSFQLMRDIEVWLPCDFPFTFRSNDPAGNEIAFGSSIRLVDQLESLNRRTWNAADDAIAQWRFDGAAFQAPLEIGAKFAFAVMLALARDAVAHRLIMKLDY
ncbi:MAG TPA: hypothetical protein VH740_18635 [Vicinamibacterales bacterium]|jgi:hypothetical protein